MTRKEPLLPPPAPVTRATLPSNLKSAMINSEHRQKNKRLYQQVIKLDLCSKVSHSRPKIITDKADFFSMYARYIQVISPLIQFGLSDCDITASFFIKYSHPWINQSWPKWPKTLCRESSHGVYFAFYVIYGHRWSVWKILANRTCTHWPASLSICQMTTDVRSWDKSRLRRISSLTDERGSSAAQHTLPTRQHFKIQQQSELQESNNYIAYIPTYNMIIRVSLNTNIMGFYS